MATKNKNVKSGDAKLAEEKFKQAISEFNQKTKPAEAIKDPREQIAKWRVAVLGELTKTDKGFEVLPAKLFASIKEIPLKHLVKKIPEQAVALHKNTVAATQTVVDIHQTITTKIKQTKLPNHFRLWLHIFTIIILGVAIYAGLVMFRPDRHWTTVAKVLPWPAAYVNGHFIMLSEVNSNTAPIIRLYESKLNRKLYSEEIAKVEAGALDKLINDQLISLVIKDRHIVVTEAMLKQARQDFIQSFSDERAMRQFVATSYGWTYDEFEQNIMKPYLMQIAFEKYLLELPNVQLAAKQVVGLYKDQITSGLVNFETLAKGKSNDANTSEQGGDLGWVQAGTMEPALEKIISNLKIGEISEPIRTPNGYHIFKVIEKTATDKDTSWHLAHIMVEITNVETWLKHELQFASIYKLVRIY